MKLPSFKRLQEYERRFAKAHSQLEMKSKRDLARLRQDLREAIISVNSWLRSARQGKRKLRPEKRTWLEQLRDELETLDLDLAARLIEIEEEQSLHREWEELLLPEPIVGKIIYPTYPLLSPYESADLISVIDDTWFPVSRSRSRGG